MRTMNNNKFLDYLDELFPNPKCELNYNKDYELLLAVVLSAQTTDKRVNEVTKILFSKYDTLDKLKNANIDDISAIIRPIGTFNKKSVFVKEIASYLLDNCNGIVPNNKSELVKMPGVGVKTANVVLSNLYDYPAIAVDTHVSRVSKRMGYAKETDEVGTIEKKLQKRFPKNRWSRLHHQMVLFGRYRCKSISPMCNDCKIKDICKYYKKKKA